MAIVVLQIGIIYFVGHFFAFLFKKYKIPDVLLFMFLGLLLGPILGLATPADFGDAGRVLSTMALLIILFQSGVTLNLKSLAEVSLKGSGLTLFTFFTTLILVSAFSYIWSQSWMIALLTGVILAGTSSAVVIPMSQALNMSERNKNILLLESSITDVLCIILTLALTRTFMEGGFQVSSLLGQIILSFVIAMLAGFLAGVLWSHYKMKMRSLATIAFVLMLYGLVELLGYSGPIAVMSMGFALANATKFVKNYSCMSLTEAENEFYTELSFVLKTFFFIYLGISMKFESPLLLLGALIITLAVIAIRHIFVLWLQKNDSESNSLESTYITLMIPKGLAAAVLAEVPIQKGLVGAEVIPQMVYAMVLVSIIVVSILIPLLSLKKRKNFLEKSG